MVKISVVGTGYVGSVLGACLADFGNHVFCVDTDAEKIEGLKNGMIPIYEPGLELIVRRNCASGRLSFTTDLSAAIRECSVVFIAVGTPLDNNGCADLSYVETVARQIGSLINKYTVIVNKSTVPIGTARKVIGWVGEELAKRGEKIEFDVISNPEFVREGSAVHDFTNPDRIVIGYNSERARNIMKDVYRSFYLNETPFIETGFETAEMVKYASNAFLAVKITFINEIANLCEKTGADIQDVARAIGKDGRIGSKFLHPGPGYGGSCFPKDTKVLAMIGNENNETQNIVEATIKTDEQQKIRAAKKIETALGSLDGKTIAVLGLAFKPNTDDTREAAALAICAYLAERGAKLRLYDPAAMKEAELQLAKIKHSVYFAKDEYDAMCGSDALVIATEWNQFRNLDLSRVKKLLSSSCFFDLRNIYKKEKIESEGLLYFGTGIK